MFIVTARIPKKRLLAACAALLCCCVAVVVGIFCTQGLQAISASSSVSAEVRGMKDNESRVSYLEGLGWQVSAEPIATEELMIPKTFDESYDAYLELQTKQGFQLSDYCGKRIKRYTYEVMNHPSGETGVQVALLIYKNRLIGGEVLSVQPNGFIHSLAMPEAAS